MEVVLVSVLSSPGTQSCYIMEGMVSQVQCVSTYIWTCENTKVLLVSVFYMLFSMKAANCVLSHPRSAHMVVVCVLVSEENYTCLILIQSNC